MSPLFVRIFTLVGMALAAASLQMKARADTLADTVVQQSTAPATAQRPAATDARIGGWIVAKDHGAPPEGIASVQYPPPLIEPSRPLPRRRRSAGHAAAGWALVFSAVLLGAGFAADLPGPVGAPKVQPQVLQQVVQQQLQALAHENAGAAFALADTGLRTQFGTPEAFLQTVRDEYPMLMHPASVLFLKPETDGTIAMQKVRLTDEEGTSWSLTYLLNRHRDNQWRIAGCVVTPEGKQVTT